MNITHYALFGERNSGTKYLEQVLNDNFYLTRTGEYGFKHWYIKGHQPRGPPNTTTDRECIRPLNDSDHVLFVYTYRNLVDWVHSMHKNPWHAPDHQKLPFSLFIRKPWKSYEKRVPYNHQKYSKIPWAPDKNGQCLIETSKNIVSLWYEKHAHFMALKNVVKHFIVIRQDHLLQDLTEMVSKYGLKMRNDSILLKDYKEPTKAECISKEDLQFLLA